MSERLLLQGISVDVKVGVYDWERESTQVLRVDLEMPIDATRAAQSDNVAETVDYAAVIEDMRAMLVKKEYKLVETIAVEIADRVMQQFWLKQIKVSVSKKPPIEGLENAVVVIDRF